MMSPTMLPTAPLEAEGFDARTETRPTPFELSVRIAREVAGPNADDVDRQARFPVETLEACRREGLLSVLIPEDLGGWGAPLTEVADSVFSVARHCASSAMVLAMHHLQVACLVRHGQTEAIRQFTAEVARRQLLLASATTEINIGGQLRTSSCAVEAAEGCFRLEKQAPVISYGEAADAILVTARRHPEAAPSDQVLVVCRRPAVELHPISGWDTLGMRGTCSNGFHLRSHGPLEMILPDPFADIAERTMVPVAHILWSCVWLGIAADAATRARASVQSSARKSPGTVPLGATALAELMVCYRRMEALVRSAARHYDGDLRTGSIAGSLTTNALKIASSTDVVDIVNRAMGVCGINGYRNDSPYSVSRHLRDAHGSVVMVNNDRILADNAHLILVDKEEV
jgi:acyl-CoA dehydrogenase